MKRSKNTRYCKHAWALYIDTGANKECSFEEYLRINKKVEKGYPDWLTLNRTFKRRKL